MSSIPTFSEGQVESLAKLLGDCGSGSDISRVLHDRRIADSSGQSTKWRRLYWIFLESQKYGNTSQILDFIKAFLTPARFVGRNDEFEANRQHLNTILSFSGLEYGPDGQFRKRGVAQPSTKRRRELERFG